MRRNIGGGGYVFGSASNRQELMMPDEPPIVVIGYRKPDGVIERYETLTTNEYFTRFKSPREVDPNGGEAEAPADHVAVRVNVDDSSNRSRAEAAAKILVKAISREIARLGTANPATVIQIGDKNYTVGAILGDLLNTEFTVTDRTNFGNNGVGQALRGADGFPNTDLINMNAILDQYGASTWIDGEGMVLLVYHEMGHISAVGHEFFISNVDYYSREPDGIRAPDCYLPPTDYSINLEAFANDFKNALGTELGMATGPNPPDNTVGHRDPADIYHEHMTDAGP